MALHDWKMHAQRDGSVELAGAGGVRGGAGGAHRLAAGDGRLPARGGGGGGEPRPGHARPAPPPRICDAGGLLVGIPRSRAGPCPAGVLLQLNRYEDKPGICIDSGFELGGIRAELGLDWARPDGLQRMGKGTDTALTLPGVRRTSADSSRWRRERMLGWASFSVVSGREQMPDHGVETPDQESIPCIADSGV